MPPTASANSAASCSLNSSSSTIKTTSRVKSGLARLPKLWSFTRKFSATFNSLNIVFIRGGIGKHHFRKNRKTALSDLNNTLTDAMSASQSLRLAVQAVHSRLTNAMSALGQKRRPLHQTAAGRCPLCPLSDRDCLAPQYVAKGQFRTHASQQEAAFTWHGGSRARQELVSAIRSSASLTADRSSK
jgi:hypothetical protein